MPLGSYALGTSPYGSINSNAAGPAQATQVEPLVLPESIPKLPENNWEGGVEVETIYLTDVTVSESLAEDRMSLRTRPVRRISNRFTGMSQEKSKQILMSLARKGSNRLVYPIFSDKAKLTSAYTASASTISCPTSHRRFYTGARILITEEGGMAITVIRGIGSEALTIDPVSSSFSPDARVYPLIDCEIDLASTLNNITDYHVEIDFNAYEVSGLSALPSTTPSATQQFKNYPVMTVPVNWAFGQTTGMVRAGARANFDRSTVVITHGPRPQHQFNCEFLSLSRGDLWEILNFFDTRKGRARAFWVLSYMTLWELSAVTTKTITVNKGVNLEDIDDFIGHIGIVKKDGTHILATVANVEDIGNDFLITTVEDLPSLSVSDIQLITSAHLVRYTNDSMVERWTTDETCETSFQLIELLDETDVILTGVS